MPLSRDLRGFVECLNSNKVENLIVGALAVRLTPENAQRILSALRTFGFGALDISIADLTVPGRVIQLGYEPNRIDLMTSITGVPFDEAWDSRATGEIDGLPVVFIGRAALLRNKEATGRGKDKIDAEELRKQGPAE
jgi:hypothetical protein